MRIRGRDSITGTFRRQAVSDSGWRDLFVSDGSFDARRHGLSTRHRTPKRPGHDVSMIRLGRQERRLFARPARGHQRNSLWEHDHQTDTASASRAAGVARLIFRDEWMRSEAGFK